MPTLICCIPYPILEFPSENLLEYFAPNGVPAHHRNLLSRNRPHLKLEALVLLHGNWPQISACGFVLKYIQAYSI